METSMLWKMMLVLLQRNKCKLWCPITLPYALNGLNKPNHSTAMLYSLQKRYTQTDTHNKGTLRE